MYYQVLFMWILARMDMLTLHVLTFINILQHRSPTYCVSSVPFIYCLILLWLNYQYKKLYVLVHGTCHCYHYTCSWLYNMYCPYTWTVIVHIVWKYKYSHYIIYLFHNYFLLKNIMLWQYFHSFTINTIHTFRKRIHFILHHMF